MKEVLRHPGGRLVAGLTLLALVSSASDLPPTPDPTYGLPLPSRLIGEVKSAPDAHWIWTEHAANNQTIYARAVINLPKVPAVAQMSITADNFFTLYVNGQCVDKTVPDAHSDSAWQTVRRPVITQYLQPGRNVIAVVGTNVDGPAGLLVRLDSGGRELLLSSADWKVSESKRLPPNWTTTNYSDASWPNATVVANIDGGAWQGGIQGWPTFEPGAAYLAHLSLPATAVEVLSGVGIINGAETLTGTKPVCLVVEPAPPGTTNPTALVLDFGREVAGRIQVTGSDNAQVQVNTGESREEAVLAGWAPPVMLTLQSGMAQYTPYIGFRFVKISFFGDASCIITNLAADLKYYPVVYKGSFACSDSRLTRIWYGGAYTAHLCMQEHILDGVKRDRILWSGDVQVSGKVINDAFADTFLMEKDLNTLRGAIQSGRPDTALPQGEMNSIPGYSAAWFCTLADFYRHVGDTAFLTAEHDMILSLLQYEQTDFDGRNIYTNPHNDWDFTDWSADLSCYIPHGSTDSAEAREATDLSIIHGVREAVFLLKAMGDTNAANRYSTWADKLTAAARQYLVNTNTGTYTGRRQVNVMAVLSGVATTKQMESIYQSVLRPGTPDWSNDITPYYAGFLLDAYSRLGHTQDGLDLARDLWGNMLAQGATTFWERYSSKWRWAGPGVTRSPAGGDYEMSLCHGWSTGVASWLTEQVLGIRPIAGGFETAELAPDLGDLRWVEGDAPTPNGKLHVYVEKNGPGQIAHVDLPTGTTVDVGLIGRSVTVDGVPVTKAREQEGRVFVRLTGPGSHIVASRTKVGSNSQATAGFPASSLVIK